MALVIMPAFLDSKTIADDTVFVALVFIAFVIALWSGWSVIVAAPIFSLLLAGAHQESSIPQAIVNGFTTPTGRFVSDFIVLFVLGAILGRTMTASGAAARLADFLTVHIKRTWAPVAVAALCALMTMGGVGVFVIAFSIYPIARDVHQRLGLPSHLIPAGIALGAFTVTMTALPGAPSLTNVAAAQYLGTTVFAAPLPGLVASAVMALFGGYWLTWRAHASPVETPSVENAPEVVTLPLWRALLPLIVAIAVNAALSLPVGSGWVSPQFEEGLRMSAIPVALTSGIVVALLSVAPSAVRQVLNTGAADSSTPLIGAAMGVGFGSMLIKTPAMFLLVDIIGAHLDPAGGTYAAMMSTLYGGLLGSSAAGIYLVLEAHGTEMLSAGADPETLHRFASLGSGVLGVLPHGGAVIALLAVCRERYATAYFDVFMVGAVGPGIAVIATLLLFA